MDAQLQVFSQELRGASYIMFDTSVRLVEPALHLEYVPPRILLSLPLIGYGLPVGSVSSPIYCSGSGSRSRFTSNEGVQYSVALSVILSLVLAVALPTSSSKTSSVAPSATSFVVLAVAPSVPRLVASSLPLAVTSLLYLWVGSGWSIRAKASSTHKALFPRLVVRT